VPVPTPASAAITVKADSSDMDRGLRTRGANRFVRFQALRVGVRAGRSPAQHIGNAHSYARIIGAFPWDRRRLMPAVGAYARPIALRSRKAAAAILASTSVLAFSLSE
jgi:hypothetical protein